MIKLFITDLDGCVSFPHQTPDWEVLTKIRTLIEKSKTNKNIPPITICSGRPLPYVEAISQLLGMEQPMIFESGAGIYNMQTNEIFWSPDFTDELEKELHQIKKHFHTNYIEKIPGTISEFTKRMDAGLINPNTELILEMNSEIVPYIEENHPNFEVHHTEVSINVIYKKANKGHGIRRLADMLNLKLEEIAYIGDTGGDISALKIVGKSFAPANAIQAVKDIVDHPLHEVATEAVLKAYMFFA